MRLRLDIAYLGAGFHGWQLQPGLRTVQGELTEAVARLLGRRPLLTAAGRTDTGVHARGQVCHLDVETAREAERLAGHLPGRLSPDLQLLRLRPVPAGFDARFSALSRRYRYHFTLRRDICREVGSLHLPAPLDRAAVEWAAAHLVGTHDFASFCKRSSLHPTGNRCVVDLCRFHWRDDSAIFEVRANRFLHHMVRIMVGTLLEIGRGRRSADGIRRLLAARDRSLAGRTAPAHGLWLEEVVYPAAFAPADELVPVRGV
jgi:tRNA pseudouridine38-40 synthase